MIGKKNIVFGFLFLVTTAALGPLMVQKYETVFTVLAEKQQTVGRLQSLSVNEFEEELEALSDGAIARANTAGILTLNKLLNAQYDINFIRGGPHAHGNLESMLNIVVGVVLCFLALSPLVKQVISWMFIVGTLLHSGAAYLGTVFGLGWANAILQTGVGPGLILLGLLIMGIASYTAFQGRLVHDT